MAGEQEVVAMVVVPSEYVQHINEVAGLTTSELIVIKRKFASTDGYELVKHPVDQCTSVTYFDERSVMTIVSGLLLTALIALILVGLVLNWNDLDDGTRVPIGALALAGVYGVTRVFGSRRHRFVFTMQGRFRQRAECSGLLLRIEADCHLASVQQVTVASWHREVVKLARLRRRFPGSGYGFRTVIKITTMRRAIDPRYP